MALVLADRVQEITTTSGTGTITLNGAVPGFQDFLTGIGSGNTTFYTIYDPTTYDWEVGIGTFTSSGTDTLSRDTVLSNSLGTTAKINLAGNQTNVFVTYPSEKSVNLDSSGNVSPLGTIASGTWQGSTVGVAYGGTGVTTSSGANSVVLRDSNQNIVANKISQSVANVTASGGTTTLTSSSAFWQTLQGTGAHTIKLPDATTLPIGFWYIFDNDSTGNLTVQDFASSTLDVVPPGGYSLFYLDDISSVAGSWNRAGLIPSDVNWGTNSLDLGGSTVVTNGTWQGTAVAPAYGGTGLTTFSGANNALYSTGASTLTAGTLPIAAGGTGQTTANAALNALLPSQTSNSGKYLTTDGTNSSWATVTQTTFSAGTTGFTPSTPTSGAVTLAGTLNVSNGGTGLTSLTTNYIPYGNGTGAYQSSATLTYNGTTLTASNFSTGGNLTFTGTANRITGDFSNATFADRASFQSSTTNGTTRICVLPNGTATSTSFNFFNNSDPTNSGRAVVGIESTKCYVQASISGTGTYLPLTLETSGSEAMRIDTSGNVGIGTSSPNAKVDSSQSTGFNYSATRTSSSGYNGLAFYENTTNTSYLVEFGSGAGGGQRLQMWTNTAFPITFGTNNTERMRIDSSGNLLYRNTTSAVYDTNSAGDVSGFWSAQFSSANNQGKLLLGTASNQGAIVGAAGLNTASKYIIPAYINCFLSTNTAGSETGEMAFLTKPSGGAAAERLRIGASGQLGIGGANYGSSGQVLTSQGSGAAPAWTTISTSAFPAGTRMSFQQTSAPTGWTKDTTAAINDSILRLVTGSVSSGGSTAFSTFNGQTATGATTLSTAQMPSHTHNSATGTATNGNSGSGLSSTLAVVGASGATGGGGSHTHSVTTSLKYYDFIIASKD